MAAAVLFASLATNSWAQDTFLGDYSKLKADASVSGSRWWLDPDVDLSKYGKLYLGPIEIWYSRKNQYRGIDPEQLKLLTDTLRVAMIDALEPAYPVVERGGAGVLDVRLAVTDVRYTKKKNYEPYKPRVFSLTPIGAAASLAAAGADNVYLAEANIEAELLDGTTGNRIGALVHQMSAGGTVGQPSWNAVLERLSFYGKRFRKRMDAAHGR
jgi:hypothetical protein